MSKSEIFPYRHQANGLDVAFEVLQKPENIKVLGNEIDLRGNELKSRIEIKFTLRVTADLVAAILPPAEWADPPVDVVLVEEGDRARRRVLTKLKAAGDENFEATWDCSLEEYFGEVWLTPKMVRSSIAPAEKGLAAHQGAIVASGQPVSLFFDDRPPTAGDLMDIEFHSFREGGKDGKREWLKERSQLLYDLETKGSRSLLLLNSDVPYIQTVLAENVRGRNKRIKDATYSSIILHVWSQLFSRATDKLNIQFRQGGDVPGEATAARAIDTWAVEVIERWASELHPDLKTADEYLGEFEKSWDKDPAGVREKVDEAIQKLADPRARTFEGLLTLGKGGS